MNLGKRATEALGLKPRSEFIDAGPIPHQGIVYDKQKGVVAVKG